MAQRYADFFPERVNLRVPLMAGLGAIGANPSDAILYEWKNAIPAVSATLIFNATAITNVASTITTGLPYNVNTQGTSGSARVVYAPWGQSLTVKGGTAGDNAVVTLTGRDYLGQKMQEALTLKRYHLLSTARRHLLILTVLQWLLVMLTLRQLCRWAIRTCSACRIRSVAIAASLINGCNC
jgi:hypothetical protein